MRSELIAANRRKIAFTATFTLLIAVSQILAQSLTTPGASKAAGVSWGLIILQTVVAAALIWFVLSLLDKQANASSTTNTVSKRAPFIAGLIMLLAWMPVYLTFWPLASMNDTHWILRDPLGAAVQHPLIYNLWVSGPYQLGISLFGSELAGVVLAALVQMLLWAGVLVFLLHYLQSVGISKVGFWVLTAFFAVFPLLADYAFALVKDSFFAVFVIALVPILLKLRQTRGAALKHWVFFAATVLVLVGFAVARNNGLVVMFGVAILIIIYSASARVLAIAASVVAIGISLIPTYVTSQLVGPQRFKEAVGIPMQQIGYTALTNPACIPDASNAYFNEILPMEQWGSAYNPKSVDPIKDPADFDSEFLTETKGEFLKQWAATLASCRPEFVRAYLMHTQPLWSLQGGFVRTTSQSFFDSPVSNFPGNKDELLAEWASRGVEEHSLMPSAVQSMYRTAIYYTPTNSVWIWASVLAIFAFAYRRRNEWVGIFGPTILITATLLIAAPTTMPFRYIASVLVIVPTAYAILLGTRKLPVEKTSEPIQPARHRQQ